MKRHLLLAAGLGLLALGTSAQEKAVGAGKAEPTQLTEQRGKIVRDEPAALRVQDMTMDELQQRLAEYEAGKRDDRDGYIIAHQLWFNYRGRKEEASAAGRHSNQLREDLLRKHPEFAKLKDFRLSDRISHQLKQNTNTNAAKPANAWVPPDSVPLRILGNGRSVVAVYQYRLEFLKLPGDLDLRADPATKQVLKLFRDGREISPSELVASKKITFKRRFEIMPWNPDQVVSNFLLCTDFVNTRYSAKTDEERRSMQANGFGAAMPWINHKGAIEQACQVMSLDGDIVFSFPITQALPNSLVAPVGISADGKKAVVMVGEKTDLSTEYGPVSLVGKPRMILVWEKDKALKKIKFPDSNVSRNELVQRFERGEF